MLPDPQQIRDITLTYVEASRQSALHKVQVIPIDIPNEVLK